MVVGNKEWSTKWRNAMQYVLPVTALATIVLCGCGSMDASKLVSSREGSVLNEVAAEEFVVRDSTGRDRAYWRTEDDGRVIRLAALDESGKRRIDIGLRDGGEAWFRLSDEKGMERWAATCSEAKGALLEMSDGEGRVRLRIGSSATGEPIVEMLDSEGRVVRKLP